MKLFLIILLVLLAAAYWKQLNENEDLRQDYVSRGLRIDELKQENEKLYSSLIKAEKETEKAEARASGFEAETERLQRAIDIKSKFIAQEGETMSKAPVICEYCETVFYGGVNAYICPQCRKKLLSELAKKRDLSGLGVAARRKKKEGKAV